MSEVEIKICGLSRPQDVEAAVRAGATAVGVVFASSPRQVDPGRARELLDAAGGVERIAVFRMPTEDELRAIAKGLKAELWMSAHTHRESKRDADGIPEPVAAVKDSIDVILAMAHDGKSVHLRLLKDHDNPNVSDLSLALDPTTMLLVKG